MRDKPAKAGERCCYDCRWFRGLDRQCKANRYPCGRECEVEACLPCGGWEAKEDA